ncbi:MAG: hypothetical protein ACJAWW_001616 [Sulfurimonas sp.]|jgi:hypothetical protein
MRKGEATLITLLIILVTSIASVFIEDRYGVSIVATESIDSNSTKGIK